MNNLLESICKKFIICLKWLWKTMKSIMIAGGSVDVCMILIIYGFKIRHQLESLNVRTCWVFTHRYIFQAFRRCCEGLEDSKTEQLWPMHFPNECIWKFPYQVSPPRAFVGCQFLCRVLAHHSVCPSSHVTISGSLRRVIKTDHKRWSRRSLKYEAVSTQSQECMLQSVGTSARIFNPQTLC